MISISKIPAFLRFSGHPSYDWLPSSTNPPLPSDEYNQLDVKALATRFSGKLLLQEEIPLEPSIFERLLLLHLFTPVQSIQTTWRGWHCRRCGNRAKRQFANLPCARCRRTHVYCRKCIAMGRVLKCESLYFWTGPNPQWIEEINPCRWQGELTPHQQAASDKIKSIMQAGSAELLVWAVCGAGKTEMLFQGISKSLAAGKRVCIATPRTDVVKELLSRFQHAYPNTIISGLYGGSKDKGEGQLVIATTHQLLRFASAFNVIVIDEIDAFPFHNDPSLPFAAYRAARPEAARIYLTATPRKEQRRRLQFGQLSSVFVPVRYHGHPLPVPQLIMPRSLKKALKKHMPPAAFFSWMKQRKKPDRQLLIFVPNINLARNMEAALKQYRSHHNLEYLGDLKKMASVHASDPDRDRKVQLFRHKKIMLLITTTILERGVTFPSVDVIVFDAGHPVFDQAALIQIAGRAGRSPYDPEGEVIFYHDGKTAAMAAAVKSMKAMNEKAREV